MSTVCLPRSWQHTDSQTCCRARVAAEGDRDKLLAIAQEHENARSGYAGDLEGLERELEGLERTAAIKQQEYVDARNAAQGVSQRVEELRYVLQLACQVLVGLCKNVWVC